MNTPINNGGAAFPRTRDYASDNANGMSLRDWFAGQALHAMSFQDAIQEAIEEGVKPTQAGEYVAMACYKMADAMIAAREAKQ